MTWRDTQTGDSKAGERTIKMVYKNQDQELQEMRQK